MYTIPLVYTYLSVVFERLLLSIKMVGVQGFEPWTPWSQTRCATRLRYTPNKLGGGWEDRTPINSLQSCRNPIILIPLNWSL